MEELTGMVHASGVVADIHEEDQDWGKRHESFEEIIKRSRRRRRDLLGLWRM